ncbi:DNA-binding response regulator [Caulobacter flavus]|jgi:FixJ family two-component response regulator|uniref:DNA-binding response regulator n=1 Tax=Caulobacter flavus TaxID=1679497 RepID=A0A2N5CKG6_9CAUL|nr:response regulator transcription factor [Caulobacter flavus]AYV47674.1 DNA-binding response regulator [Caulobacter flavus]PLR05828.1 DNA-binding response regulator [Caulobacter flavus]
MTEPLAYAQPGREIGRRLDDDLAPVVIVVDDDDAVRLSICELLESVGMASLAFASTRELLDADVLDRPGCMILDVRMPGLSGLDFQNHLAASGILTSIIFLTGHGDIPMTVQAMKAGAVEFLTKPARDQTLLDAVNRAVTADLAKRGEARTARENAALYQHLTPRERQVMRAVVQGALNKQIAYELGITEVTVKLHRSSLMKKMRAPFVTHLVRAWQSLPADLREELVS